MKRQTFKLVWESIHEHYQEFIVYFLTIFFALLIAFLMNINLQFIILLLQVSSVFCVLFWLVEISHTYKKLKWFSNNFQNISGHPEYLSTIKTSSTLEKNYQKIIKDLIYQKEQLTKNYENSKNEQEEYFTLWQHQIKTPLSALRLMSETQENVKAENIRNQTLQIQRYLEMSLQYNRLSSINQDLKFEKINLSNLIREVVNGQAFFILQKNLKISFPTVNTSVISDYKWLFFSIDQVLFNAIKYTPEGDSINLNVQKNIQHSVTLSVTDNGIGISSDDLPRIFERGYTGYTGRQQLNSTGLGLYLTKKTTDTLNIKLTVSSEKGAGTTVIFTFLQI